MHSPASKIDRDLYKVKCYIRAQCGAVAVGTDIAKSEISGSQWRLEGCCEEVALLMLPKCFLKNFQAALLEKGFSKGSFK